MSRRGCGWLLAVLVGCSAAPAPLGGRDARSAVDAPVVAPDVPASVCATRITYGSAWIRGSDHAAQFDEAAGEVTWDGNCTADAHGNSYAMLSNGFQPFFTGASACVLALDESAACGSAAAAACTTRIHYGPGWLPPANHPDQFDDIAGRVFGDGTCVGGTYAQLSNGFQPHFSGGTCPLAFRYDECGGLYANPVIAKDCPDPGVLRDGDQYVLSCTSGDAANAFPIYTSPDLATWTAAGHILPTAAKPTWAVSDYWAPEIHLVGGHYVAYFSARNGSDSRLSIGAATAASATGPFTALGAPLIHDAAVGLIDVSEITASDGTPYVIWKEDGNANGQPTPIHAQQLAADGLSLVGSAATLITNDQTWEGAVTEGPWMVEHGGMFYLFYSGNSYANTTYAVGVARGPTPLGPMTKLASNPILRTGGAWAGPGHCSVLDTPAGDTVIIYHAWPSGCVGGAGCGREDLVDEVLWGSDGWPSVPLAPSATTRPLF